MNNMSYRKPGKSLAVKATLFILLLDIIQIATLLSVTHTTLVGALTATDGLILYGVTILEIFIEIIALYKMYRR